MIKIAVCDDEKIFIDQLYSHLNFAFENLFVEISIDTYINAGSLLNAFRSLDYDVVFLDIDMPAMSGFEVAKKIRETSISTNIVFVTAKHDLVYNSFEYQPFYFICKRTPNELCSEIEHVAEKLLTFYRQSKRIEIKDSVVGSLKISLKDIIYIQSDKHYLFYYTKDNSEFPIKERGSLPIREAELCECGFLKSHQRYLVNMNHISCFDSLINTIVMSNKHQIPISKKLKSNVLEQYRLFKRR